MTSRKEECIQRAAGALLAAREAYQKGGGGPAPNLGFHRIRGFSQEDAEAEIRAIVDRYRPIEDDEKTKDEIRNFVAAIKGLSGGTRARIERALSFQKTSFLAKVLVPDLFLEDILEGLRLAALAAAEVPWGEIKRPGALGAIEWSDQVILESSDGSLVGVDRATSLDKMLEGLWRLHKEWAGEPEPPYGRSGSGKNPDMTAWEEMVQRCLDAIDLGGSFDSLRKHGALRKVHQKMGGRPRRAGRPRKHGG